MSKKVETVKFDNAYRETLYMRSLLKSMGKVLWVNVRVF